MDVKKILKSTWAYAAFAVVLLAATVAILSYRKQVTQIDEDMVYAFYQKSINATQMLDAKTLCALMDRDYRVQDVAKTPKGEVKTLMNRRQACEDLEKGMAEMRQLVNATGVKPEFKYTIKSIRFSPERDQAIVQMHASMRIGKVVSVDTVGTDFLVKRQGKIRSLGSNTITTLGVSPGGKKQR